MAEITLKTITPVHIGTGLSLGMNEYINDSDNHKLHRIAFTDLVEVMDEHVREKFICSIEKQNLNLTDFISLNKISYKKKYSLQNPFHITDFHDVKEYLKTGNQIPYIPGSSIKGAIRTALLWQAADVDKLISQINEELKPENRKWISKNTIGNNYVNSVFSTLPAGKKWDAKFDLMKFIEVSDFMPVEDVQLILIPVNVYSYRPTTRNFYVKHTNYCECIEGSFKGVISVSPQLEAILKKENNEIIKTFFGITDNRLTDTQLIDLIKTAMRNFLSACISKESGLLNIRDIQSDNLHKNLIRIGSEIGTTYQTMFSCVECINPDSALNIIGRFSLRGKRWSGTQNINRNVNRINPPYPKSFEYSAEANCPLGWCEFV